MADDSEDNDILFEVQLEDESSDSTDGATPDLTPSGALASDQIVSALQTVERVDTLSSGSISGRHALFDRVDFQRMEVLTATNDSERSSLVHQSQLLRSLRHPYVPLLIHAFEADDGQFVQARQYVSGSSLSEWRDRILAGEAQLEWQTRLETVARLTFLIEYLHHEDVALGGLSLDSVRYGVQGQLVVTDWSHAKKHKSLPIDAKRKDLTLLARVCKMFLTLSDDLETPCVRLNPVLPFTLDEALQTALEGKEDSSAALRTRLMGTLRSDRERLARAKLSRDHSKIADQSMQEANDLQVELDWLDEQIHSLSKKMDFRTDPLTWTDLAELQAQRRELDNTRTQSVSEATAYYRLALRENPKNHDARDKLGDFYKNLVLEAEYELRPLDAAPPLFELESIDDGRFTDFLRGDGTLKLSIPKFESSRLELFLYRNLEDNEVLVPVPHTQAKTADRQTMRTWWDRWLDESLQWPHRLGQTFPEEARIDAAELLGECTMPMGSWLLIASAEGHHPVRYPFRIDRNGTWVGELEMWPEGSIPEDMIVIPGGPFIKGGDPETQGTSAPLDREAEVPTFMIGQYQISCGEYLAFINDRDFHSSDEALKRVPRWAPDAEFWWEADDKGMFQLPEPQEYEGFFVPWADDLPIHSVSWEDAMAFCEWRSKQASPPNPVQR